MKTNTFLTKAEVILNGEVIDTIEVKNPCQMWTHKDEWFKKYGDDVEIKVYTANGNLFKHWVRREQKNTKKMQCVNLVKETNRWHQMQEKKAKEAAKAKREAKNAKARERYARKKAEKAAVNGTQVVTTEVPQEATGTVE